MSDYLSERGTLRDSAAAVAGKKSRRRLRIPVDLSIDPYELPIEDFNVANPELFKHDAFHGYFKRLREEAPVHYCADSQYGPYWSITRYDDIMEVEKSHDIFSSSFEFGGVTITGTPESSSHIQMFIQMDPPKHDGHRKMVAPKFTQRSLAELETLIRARAGNILDGLPTGKTFDWVSHVSVELTGRMLATLLGVPQEDRGRIIGWSNTISNADNPEYVSSGAQFYEALAECGEYFDAQWRERKARGEPGDDLISMLAYGEHTHDMTAEELLGNVVLLLVGGNDTTRNSISGGVLALNDFPGEYDKLRSNHSLINSMVPEIIRWQTPLTSMRRTAKQDIKFRGQHIKKGDVVVMWYISGNRDMSAIEHADQFIIDRARPREHLSFGFGIHRCLGNRLAEMQLRVLWEEILTRFHTVEVVGKPVRANSSVFRAIQELPVRLTRL